MADYKMTLDDLRNQLAGLDEYVPEDEAALRQRAVDIYSPQYQADLNRLRDQIEFQVGRQHRSAVNTGMQRSSYNSAQEASIRRGGLQSEADMSVNYQSNIANMLYNMLEKEKDRKNAADQYRNQLLFQLYGMQPTGGGGQQRALPSSIGAGAVAGMNAALGGLNGLNASRNAGLGLAAGTSVAGLSRQQTAGGGFSNPDRRFTNSIK